MYRKVLEMIKRIFIRDRSVLEDYILFLFETEQDSAEAPKIIASANLMSPYVSIAGD